MVKEQKLVLLLWNSIHLSLSLFAMMVLDTHLRRRILGARATWKGVLMLCARAWRVLIYAKKKDLDFYQWWTMLFESRSET